MVCMKLHNLCVDKSCPIPQRRFAEGYHDGDEWAVHDNNRDDDGLHRVRALGERRWQITANLEHSGILQPAHAQMNNRCY